MTGGMETAAVHTVMLPPLILAVTDYSLAAARDYRGQNDISGGLHLTTPGIQPHRLLLRGHITAESRAETAAALSRMLVHQTALSFSVDKIRFSGFQVAEYTLSVPERGYTAEFSVTLIGTEISEAEAVEV